LRQHFDRNIKRTPWNDTWTNETANLSSITLLTNRQMPVFDFYQKNGMVQIENTVFMYKSQTS